MLSLLYNRAFSKLAFTLIAVTLVGPLSTAAACPRINGLIDFNCDGQLKFVFTGDSIVAGKGDAPGGQGYVGRLASVFPYASIQNLGVGGLRSYQFVPAFRRGSHRNSVPPMVLKSHHADLVMIDVGRNDYLARKAPLQVIREIKRIVSYVRLAIMNKDGTAPFVAVATLLPIHSNTRGNQKNFAEKVNHLLLKEKNKGTLPVFVRFDKVRASLISKDGLHPSPGGFEAMRVMVEEFIVRQMQIEMSAQRPDSDADGIFDIFEGRKFHTLPYNADSDGDSLTDGDEIFRFRTDPLLPTPLPAAVKFPVESSPEL